jgi:hypothetical protein
MWPISLLLSIFYHINFTSNTKWDFFISDSHFPIRYQSSVKYIARLLLKIPKLPQLSQLPKSQNRCHLKIKSECSLYKILINSTVSAYRFWSITQCSVLEWNFIFRNRITLSWKWKAGCAFVCAGEREETNIKGSFGGLKRKGEWQVVWGKVRTKSEGEKGVWGGLGVEGIMLCQYRRRRQRPTHRLPLIHSITPTRGI